MAFLLDDRLAPITSEIGFIEVTPPVAVAAFAAGLEEPYVTRPVVGTLEQVLRALLPLTNVTRRYLFVPTASPWTAYFDNGHRGTYAAHLMRILAKRLRTRALRVVAVPNTIRRTKSGTKGRYGATILEVYGPQDTDFLNYLRSVEAVNDGGRWVFSQGGPPFPFEETERYTGKPIRERFTPELLDRYLRQLGLRAFDAEFYTATPASPALLLELTSPPRWDERASSLEEARAHW